MLRPTSASHLPLQPGQACHAVLRQAAGHHQQAADQLSASAWGVQLHLLAVRRAGSAFPGAVEASWEDADGGPLANACYAGVAAVAGGAQGVLGGVGQHAPAWRAQLPGGAGGQPPNAV